MRGGRLTSRKRKRTQGQPVRACNIGCRPRIPFGVKIIRKVTRVRGLRPGGGLMKIAVIIARILMGIIFVFFGLNGFLQFLKAPLPGGLAGQFLSVFFQSHWVLAVSAVQLVGGLLLLVNRYVPLALALLGPVIVNIILYHSLISS